MFSKCFGSKRVPKASGSHGPGPLKSLSNVKRQTNYRYEARFRAICDEVVLVGTLGPPITPDTRTNRSPQEIRLLVRVSGVIGGPNVRTGSGPVDHLGDG